MNKVLGVRLTKKKKALGQQAKLPDSAKKSQALSATELEARKQEVMERLQGMGYVWYI